jgi:mercuric ion transport protein
MIEQAQGMTAGQALDAAVDGGGAKPNREKMVAAGSILGGVAAMSCCILPLALFSLGAGGAWIGNLTAVAPYQPYIIAVTLGFLATGYYLVYRKPKAETCEPDSYCASPKSTRMTKIALWTSTAFVLAAISFNFLAPIFLDY